MGLKNRTHLKDKYCFFVTTTCNNWLKIIQESSSYELIINSLKFVGSKYNADYLAYVIMPNHLHFVVYFKEENRLSDLMRDFKKFTSGEIRRKLQENNHRDILSKITYEHKQQLFKIWMDGFDDVWLGKREILETKIHYIHNNRCGEPSSAKSLAIS